MVAAGKSKQRWKQAEREVAKVFDTNRIPNSGYGQPDVIIPSKGSRPQIALQIKTKAALPAWFTNAMNQAMLDAENTDGEAIPAVVVVHAPGTGIRKRRYAILRLEDAVNLLGSKSDE